ncbi:MAG: hypothetical protein ABID09_07825 [Candidatus Omnitrophota bacterium]
MDRSRYEEHLRKEQDRNEGLCKRCGECCGSLDGDPCVNLALGEDSKYYCVTYEDRLGPRRTVGGNIFNCVPINEIATRSLCRVNCSYRRI